MIKVLTAKNIRNLSIEALAFHPGVNIVVGQNGQGKTSLIEAIFILAYGKSFIADKAKVIDWRQTEARVFGQTEGTTIEILLRRDRENKILINGKQKGLATLLGKFLCVAFHPRDIEIITGSPTTRRSWLDRLLSTLDRIYLLNLIKYNKVIQNRNRVLRTADEESQLEVWDKSAAKLGAALWVKRQEVINQVNNLFKIEAERLTTRNVFLEYKVGINTADKRAEEKYLKELLQTRENDRKLLATTFGPHRDDFKIIFEEKEDQKIIQKEIASFGSRAQQRQSVLLLKLAEMRLLTEEFGEYPTFLLDDIASELDETNRGFLAELKAKQMIISTTSLELLPKRLVNKAHLYKMERGEIQTFSASSD